MIIVYGWCEPLELIDTHKLFNFEQLNIADESLT